ncbi:hypothetical protein LZG04_38590 [Saccharothrix sp. S26]|uniref:hypothetical protein n=1 Tax=Saccharothrix sp. S26 TaxID=2907215 RepID=UPI001F2E6024|nr:hypothetical protein [Saccharothrix sp. S26]MCE7000685.1 hypothetical protein [Saccharothrix sp. S26]
MNLRRATRTVIGWTAALGAAIALTATPSATASTERAMVPDGVYGITFGGDEDALLTPLSDHEGAPTVLLPAVGAPGYQEWQLVRDSNHTQIIKNLGTGLYLTLGGLDAQNHRPVVASPYPYSWVVRTGSAPNRVTLSALGKPLRLDKSPWLIYPPRVDVQDTRPDLSQEWELTFHE